MADGFIYLTDDTGFSANKAVDQETVTFGSGPTPRYRQRVQLAGSVAAELARVLNAPPASTDYAIAVRQVGVNAAGAIADGEANPTVTEMEVYPMVFNGTTWDRTRSAKGGYSLDGTGIQAVNTNIVQYPTFKSIMDRVASGTLTANTAKAVWSIEHGATAVKTVRVRRILFSAYATTAVAGTVEVIMFRGTAASSAGTGVTPVPTLPGTAAAEAVTRSNPTITQATVMGSWMCDPAPAVANSTVAKSQVLYDWQESGETQPLTLRAGNLDTLGLWIRSTAAIALTMSSVVTFTET